MALPTFPFLFDNAADLPQSGMGVEVIYATEITTARSGREQRRALWTSPVYGYTLAWERTPDALSKVDTLHAFYCARKGAFEAFIFFDPASWRTYDRVMYGTGNGSQTTFDLPSRNATSRTVYVNDVAQGSGFTFTAGAGANGRDRIVFSSPPALGATLALSFTGQLATAQRFAADSLSWQAFHAQLFSVGIQLRSVKGEW